MRLLVTGCTGFIGSHLTERLLADGHSVVGIDRGRNLANIAGVLMHPRLQHVEADLIDQDIDDLLAGCDGVFHLAARAGMSPSWDHFDEYVQANVIATERLLKAAGRAQVTRFLYVSSSSVYGKYATGAEGGSLRPCNPYGVSKLAGEHICWVYATRCAFDLTIIRPFSVYGPRQRPDMAHHLFISALLEGRPITVDGDGEQSRSNTYVLDLVDGIVRALGLPGYHDFNLGGDHCISINELVRLCEQASGIKAEIRRGPGKAGDQRITKANYSKATALLGWLPQTSLEDGIAAQVAWQRGLVKC